MLSHSQGGSAVCRLWGSTRRARASSLSINSSVTLEEGRSTPGPARANIPATKAMNVIDRDRIDRLVSDSGRIFLGALGTFKMILVGPAKQSGEFSLHVAKESFILRYLHARTDCGYSVELCEVTRDMDQILVCAKSFLQFTSINYINMF